MIEAREAEFSDNHFWGRKRAPAAPPLPADDAAPSPSDESGPKSLKDRDAVAPRDAEHADIVTGSSVSE